MRISSGPAVIAPRTKAGHMTDPASIKHPDLESKGPSTHDSALLTSHGDTALQRTPSQGLSSNRVSRSMGWQKAISEPLHCNPHSPTDSGDAEPLHRQVDATVCTRRTPHSPTIATVQRFGNRRGREGAQPTPRNARRSRTRLATKSSLWPCQIRMTLPPISAGCGKSRFGPASLRGGRCGRFQGRLSGHWSGRSALS